MEALTCGPVRRGTPWLFYLAIATLTACATRPVGVPGNAGNVAYQSIEPEDADRLQLSATQGYVSALAKADKALPIYPAQWLASRLAPVTVCVELFIDDNGRVYETHPLIQGVTCPALPPEYAAAFQQAVVTAVGQWGFVPSYICELPAGGAPDAGCAGEGVVRKPIAIRQAYRFVFRQTPQGPVVDAADAVGRR